MRLHHALSSFVSAALVMTGLITVSCTVDSADTVIRSVGEVNVSGRYTVSIVPANSGPLVEVLEIRQTGDQLEVIDNNGGIYRGTIGNITGENVASFTLKGSTKSGPEVVISGTISVDGEDADLYGTWIEDTLYANISGSAKVIKATLSISPSGPITMKVNAEREFRASGGSGSYTWTASQGTIKDESSTGSLITFEAPDSAATNLTLSVSDGEDEASVTIIVEE